MKFKFSPLSVAIATVSLITGMPALALNGKVTNQHGQPISNAVIGVIGSNQTVVTDAQGLFNIDKDNLDEIHVAADGYNHRILHLHGAAGSEPLVIQLSETLIEQMDVIGIPLHASALESAQPISVVAGADLRNKQASTLGETLKNEIGVNSTYFGPNTSSPIIRGFDGPRVLITQNGLDASDASRVAPDHSVTSSASTAKQIEILRGPSTLFYGSGAIGGVVNIVDDRVPSDNENKAAFNASYNGVADEKVLSAAWTGGKDNLAVHFDGFWRDSGDYSLPKGVNPNALDTASNAAVPSSLANSASQSQGYDLGSSWLLDNGYVGVSYGHMEKLSGVPGESEDEGDVQLDMNQDRIQLISEINLDNPLISAINTRIGYTDYQHMEVLADDHNQVGTTFKNKTIQLKTDIVHQELAGWRGALSIDAKSVDFEAIGEEAFTPPSVTDSFALALVEEKHLGSSVLLQMGARVEQVTLSADPVTIEANQVDGGDASTIANDGYEQIVFDDYSITPFSLSAGTVWDFTPGYNLGFSFTHAQRAASAPELFSVGPHVGTGSYEAGALFELHQADGGAQLAYSGKADQELSNNIDISLRKFEGNTSFVINAFYNQASNFYYQADTGFTTADIFPLQEDASANAEDLPVYLYQQDDARFYGLEAKFIWQVTSQLQWTTWSDSIRGELNNGGNLPRIPPARFGNDLVFKQGNWMAQLDTTYTFEQNHTAKNESATGDYTMIDAVVSYDINMPSGALTVYAKGENLLDTEARIHASFLKDQAPLPGRGFSLGIRGEL